MTDARVTQLFPNVATSSDPVVRVSQFYALAGVKFPSPEVENSQFFVNAAVTYDMTVRVSQLYVLAAVRGRVANPQVRAWTFTLDGHDFYVLPLGDGETLVYDTHAGQWSRWASEGLERWRAIHGINWQGAVNYAASYGSNILVGDDTLGVLWLLDPTQGYDEDPRDGPDSLSYFKRHVTGQAVTRKTNAVPCFEVFLTGSFGSPALTGQGITLYTSDDAGHNYTDHGTLTVTADEWTPRMVWSSLGQITAPGRLFRLEDYGAVVRIDALDMSDGTAA